ncbi:hypothetical protein ACP70R_019479 [Stipagrostis hirtigluma subsp. patula]
MRLTLSPVRTTARKVKTAAHARSPSQPCHPPHPALARLDGGLRALRSWSASRCGAAAADGSSPEGLALVEAVLAVLGELLGTPRAAAALHDADDDRILDGFLVLADAYDNFGSALLTARQSVAAVRAGVRRDDGAAVAASVRAHRRTEKELCHIAATMRHATTVSPRPADSGATDTKVVDIVAEAATAVAEASAAVFLGCAAMSPDVAAMVQTVSSHSKWLRRLGVVPVVKKAAPETTVVALERLEELEECIGALEGRSDKVFRRLLQTRVLILNIHNPL